MEKELIKQPYRSLYITGVIQASYRAKEPGHKNDRTKYNGGPPAAIIKINSGCHKKYP
jgi:hypothetical protein